MMDVGVIAEAVASVLMPWLLRAGEKAADGAAGKLGEDTWTATKEVWAKLLNKPQSKTDLESTADKIATSSDKAGAQKALSTLLTKILSDDTKLALELSDQLGIDLNDLYKYFQERPIDLRRSFDTLIADKAKGFIGRDFVLHELDDFIEDHRESGGYFIIQGDPGIGKTSIIAHLVKTRGYVHHFNIALQSINKPSQFLNSVCAQLIKRYELKDVIWPPNSDQDGAFLNRLVAEASKKLTENEELIIAIDALNEVDTLGLPATANMLFLPVSLPRGVFVVATTLRGHDPRIMAAHPHIFQLLPESEGNIGDVRQYIRAHVHDPPLQRRLSDWEVTEAQFVEILVKKSEGNFMYLHYALPAIKSGYFTDLTLQQLPDGLRAYYQTHWMLMRSVDPAHFDELYKPVLCILAAVKEPVSIAQIVAFTDLTSDQVLKVIKAWLIFLHEQVGASNEPLFGIYHSTFKSFLSDEVDPGLRSYHAMIARYYERMIGS